MLVPFLALVLACSTPPPPESIDECPTVSSIAARDECYATFVPALFASDPRAAAELVEARIEDPLVRDFVYLQVSRDLDPAGGRWCDLISAPVVAERCHVLARRPHLQRARVGEHAPGPGAP